MRRTDVLIVAATPSQVNMLHVKTICSRGSFVLVITSVKESGYVFVAVCISVCVCVCVSKVSQKVRNVF